jgi:hypothetical protein
MADYFSPTVIQPSIPIADITPLERLLLSQIFSAEPDGGVCISTPRNTLLTSSR